MIGVARTSRAGSWCWKCHSHTRCFFSEKLISKRRPLSRSFCVAKCGMCVGQTHRTSCTPPHQHPGSIALLHRGSRASKNCSISKKKSKLTPFLCVPLLLPQNPKNPTTNPRTLARRPVASSNLRVCEWLFDTSGSQLFKESPRHTDHPKHASPHHSSRAIGVCDGVLCSQ